MGRRSVIAFFPGRRELAGNTKITNLYLLGARQHDICGLDVEMDDALVMGSSQCGCALDGDIEKLIDAKGMVESSAQCLAVNELHDDEDFAGLFDDVLYFCHVFMIEQHCMSRLVDKS